MSPVGLPLDAVHSKLAQTSSRLMPELCMQGLLQGQGQGLMQSFRLQIVMTGVSRASSQCAN